MKKIIKNLVLLLFLANFFPYSVHSDSLPNYSIKDALTDLQEILPADESFNFSVLRIEDQIILSWELKENCFLYKDKFKIKTFPEMSIEIRTSEKPVQISDEYFGEVEVFYNKVTKSFVLNKLTKELSVKYQGCNAKGFCYPVITKQLILKKDKVLIY
tara:strand:- start:257 stop:730 length:474 start_codon:yes stop_codon:yes gene_type:complete